MMKMDKKLTLHQQSRDPSTLGDRDPVIGSQSALAWPWSALSSLPFAKSWIRH